MEYLVIVNDLDKERIIKKISAKETLIPCKVLGYREFLKKFYLNSTNETLYDIKEKYHTTIEIAEMLLENLVDLPRKPVDSKKITFLQQMKKDLLDRGLLQENKSFYERLKQQILVFYHLKDFSKEQEEIIQKCLAITKVKIIEEQELPAENIKVYECPTKKEEVIHILKMIAKQIQASVPIEKIYIANLDETYRELFQTYGKMFHIEFTLKNTDTYLGTIITTTFLNASSSIEETIEELSKKYSKPEEQENIKAIINQCNAYPFIKSEVERKEFIKHALQKEKVKRPKNSKSVHEIDLLKQEIEEDSWVYIVGFTEGTTPQIWKDEDFLNDQEKSLIGKSTSKEKNKAEEKKWQCKMKTLKNMVITYPKLDGKVEKYPSHLIENEQITLVTETDDLFAYSNQYNKLKLGTYLDQYEKYGIREDALDRLRMTYPSIEYKSYQNQFKPFKKFTKENLAISYSSLDTFFHCPFRYYVSNILNLKDKTASFNQQIGTLFHQILKDSYTKGFDFEQDFQKQTAQINFQTIQENFFLQKLKKDLKRVLEVLKKQEENLPFTILQEQKVEYELPIEPACKLTGILDKMFVLEKENQTLLSVVDYKTGNPNLDLNNLVYGINLQLPIYLLLLKKLPYQNSKVIGFYLQKILPQIPKQDHIHTEEELKQEKLKLEGYSTDCESWLKEFDSTYEDSKKISHMKKTAKGFYTYAKVLSEEAMDKIQNLAEEKVMEAAKKIQAGQFFIEPIRIGNQLVGCEYCKYQDLCYRKEQDIKNVEEIKNLEWLGGKKNADMDERTAGSNL